jgi:hypothetical protein
MTAACDFRVEIDARSTKPANAGFVDRVSRSICALKEAARI